MQNSSCEVREVIDHLRVNLKLHRHRISNSPKSTHLLLPVPHVSEGDLFHSLVCLTALLTLLKYSYHLWAMCPLYNIFPQIPIHVTQRQKLSCQLARFGSVCLFSQSFPICYDV